MKQKGKYVSRSVYQKTVEQNKRLLDDIKILIVAPVTKKDIKSRLDTFKKYRKKFQDQENFNTMLRELLSPLVKEHEKTT